MVATEPSEPRFIPDWGKLAEGKPVVAIVELAGKPRECFEVPRVMWFIEGEATEGPSDQGKDKEGVLVASPVPVKLEDIFDQLVAL